MFDWYGLAEKYHNLYMTATNDGKNSLEEIRELYNSVETVAPAPAYTLKNTNIKEYARAKEKHIHALKELEKSDKIKELTARLSKAHKQRDFYFSCREFCLRKYSSYSYAKLTEYIKENAGAFEKLKSNYKKFDKLVKSVIGEHWSIYINQDYTEMHCNIYFLNYQENKALHRILYYFEYIGYSRTLYTLHNIEDISIHYPADDEPEKCVKAFFEYIEKKEELYNAYAAAVRELKNDTVTAGASCSPLNYDESWKKDLQKEL